MPTVELLYDRDCPNAREARSHLLQAFAHATMTPHWSEQLIEDPDAPEHVRGYGSPTILIDGHDVAGESPRGERSCRLYATDDGGLSRAPSVSQIAEALARASRAPEMPTTAGGWRSSLAVAPGIGAALLPKVACPACWPAYAGFLSSIGLGVLMDDAWLLPLTASFLLVAVGALAFRARRRRGHGPFGLGLAAAGLVLVGKFMFESDAAMYAGIGLLVAASVWNTWPRRPTANCPACVTARG